MTIQELKTILMAGRFDAGMGIIWQFNDTTVVISGKPVARYELIEEDGVFYLHPETPITSNEDYIVEVLNDKHRPFRVVLTPRYTKRSAIALEQLS